MRAARDRDRVACFLHLRDLVYLHRKAASASTIAFAQTLEAAVIAEKAAREATGRRTRTSAARGGSTEGGLKRRPDERVLVSQQAGRIEPQFEGRLRASLCAVRHSQTEATTSRCRVL